MSKYEYKFEIEESINDNIGAVEVDSLESALRRILPDGIIYAICHYPVENDRTFREVIKLRHENVNQKTERDIYDYLDSEVDARRFQK
jgi:hypothetical protein